MGDVACILRAYWLNVVLFFFSLFSSFVPIRNFYPPQPPHDAGHDMTSEEEPRFILDLDHHMAKSSQVHPGVVLGGLQQQQQPVSPPLEAESSNAPLNLTLSPSSKSSLRSQPVAHDTHWASITSDQTASARLSGWACGEGRVPNVPTSNQPLSDLDKTVTRPQTDHHIWTVAQDSRANAKNKQQSNSPRKITSGAVTPSFRVSFSEFSCGYLYLLPALGHFVCDQNF